MLRVTSPLQQQFGRERNRLLATVVHRLALQDRLIWLSLCRVSGLKLDAYVQAIEDA